MTVITKPLSDNKKNKLKEPLVENAEVQSGVSETIILCQIFIGNSLSLLIFVFSKYVIFFSEQCFLLIGRKTSLIPVDDQYRISSIDFRIIFAA